MWKERWKTDDAAYEKQREEAEAKAKNNGGRKVKGKSANALEAEPGEEGGTGAFDLCAIEKNSKV